MTNPGGEPLKEDSKHKSKMDLSPIEFDVIWNDGKSLPILTKELKEKFLNWFPEIKESYENEYFG